MWVSATSAASQMLMWRMLKVVKQDGAFFWWPRIHHGQFAFGVRCDCFDCESYAASVFCLRRQGFVEEVSPLNIFNHIINVHVVLLQICKTTVQIGLGCSIRGIIKGLSSLVLVDHSVNVYCCTAIIWIWLQPYLWKGVKISISLGLYNDGLEDTPFILTSHRWIFAAINLSSRDLSTIFKCIYDAYNFGVPSPS